MDAVVLVFGGFGQVGQAVVRAGSGRDVIGLGRDDVDLTDEAAIVEALDQHRPAAVLNAAVFQPVDRCETEVAEAFAINATAAGAFSSGFAPLRRGKLASAQRTNSGSISIPVFQMRTWT